MLPMFCYRHNCDFVNDTGIHSSEPAITKRQQLESIKPIKVGAF